MDGLIKPGPPSPGMHSDHGNSYAKETYRHYRVGVDAGKKMGKEYAKGLKHGLKHGKYHSEKDSKMSDRIVEVFNRGGGYGGYGDCGMGMGGGMGFIAMMALLSGRGFGGWGGGWGGGFDGHRGFDGGHGHHGGCCIPHIPEVKACGMNEVQHKQDFLHKEICDTRYDVAKDAWANQTAINSHISHAKDSIEEKFYDFTLATGEKFGQLNNHLCNEFRSLQNANNAEFRAIDKQFCGVKLEVAESTQKVLNAISASEIERLKEKVLALELRGREDREGHRAEGIKIDIANTLSQQQEQRQQQFQIQSLLEQVRGLHLGFNTLQSNVALAGNRTVNVGGTMTASGTLKADQANSNVLG